jgi:integrase
MQADLWPRVRSAILSWDFLFLCEFLHGCGCRPSEAYRLEARHVDWTRGVAVVPAKQTRKTGRESVIVVPEGVLAWLLPLCEARPEGPVFRPATGRAWPKDSVNCQISDLRRRLGVGREAGVFAQALRHVFATDALDRGTPVATVSTLLNHADTRMVMQHYGHLADRHAHLRAAVEGIRPGDAPPDAHPPSARPAGRTPPRDDDGG